MIKATVSQKRENGKMRSTLLANGKAYPWPRDYRYPTMKQDGEEVMVEITNNRVAKLTKLGGQEWPLHSPKGRNNSLHMGDGNRQGRGGRQGSSKGHHPLEVSRLCPADTQIVYEDKFENVYLYYYRFGRLHIDDRGRGKVYLPNGKDRIENSRITSLPSVQYTREEQQVVNKDVFIRINQRLDATLGTHHRSLPFRTESRLLVGTGTANAHEFGMTFHHVYGCPYLPGSGIKGAVRSAVLTEVFAKNETAAWMDQTFCDLFGCPEESFYQEARRGMAIFYDAFPLTNPTLDTDILNPHFQTYYGSQGSKLPTDTDKPVPVFFPAVSAGTDFKFRFELRYTNPSEPNVATGPIERVTENSDLVEVVARWLTQTLTVYGLGAKNAVGYGFFTSK